MIEITASVTNMQDEYMYVHVRVSWVVKASLVHDIYEDYLFCGL